MPPAGPEPHPAGAASPWDWIPPIPSAIARPVTLLQLEGSDSLRFLHGQSSQAIELASPGQWLSTCCISPTARMRALAEVLVTDGGAWLVIRSGDGEAVRQALDRVLFPADAVHLGPLESGLLLSPVPTDGQGDTADAQACWRPLQGAEGFWLGEQLLLREAPAAATASTGMEEEARALLGRPRLAAPELERWRLQCGLPAWPSELNDDTNPFEVGLAARVSLSKGCYVGQETLAKLATYDGVRRQLRRWHCPGGDGLAAALAPGSPLCTATGERAGTITSCLRLPEADLWIGLALVRRRALGAERLWSGAAAGERSVSDGTALWLSRPPAFVDPPVGAGASASDGG